MTSRRSSLFRDASERAASSSAAVPEALSSAPTCGSCFSGASESRPPIPKMIVVRTEHDDPREALGFGDPRGEPGHHVERLFLGGRERNLELGPGLLLLLELCEQGPSAERLTTTTGMPASP